MTSVTVVDGPIRGGETGLTFCVVSLALTRAVSPIKSNDEQNRKIEGIPRIRIGKVNVTLDLSLPLFTLPLPLNNDDKHNMTTILRAISMVT